MSSELAASDENDAAGPERSVAEVDSHEAAESSDVDQSATVEPSVVLDDGEASLDLATASSVAADIGATVVLIAGSQSAGKTTLAVQLFAQFLDGPFAGLRFAGSKTLDALDKRHFLSRLASGRTEPDTVRTYESDMRLLHLRLADHEDKHQAIMLTDVKGELFDQLVDGRSFVDEDLPLAKRADKTIIMVDGSHIAETGHRQTAILRARQLIGVLTEPGALRLATPTRLALSKRDLLDASQVDWYREQADELVAFAQSRGLDDAAHLEIAARPTDGGLPTGLLKVLEWIWTRRERSPDPVTPAIADRLFWTRGLM